MLCKSVFRFPFSAFRFPLSVFRFPFSVLPPLSRRRVFWGLLGAGVPPLIGTLTSFAYWGALKELRIKNY